MKVDRAPKDGEGKGGNGNEGGRSRGVRKGQRREEEEPETLGRDGFLVWVIGGRRRRDVGSECPFRNSNGRKKERGVGHRCSRFGTRRGRLEKNARGFRGGLMSDRPRLQGSCAGCGSNSMIDDGEKKTFPARGGMSCAGCRR